MYWILGRWRESAATRRPVSRAGGPLLPAFAPVAVGDDLGRAGLDDLAIFRDEVLRQFAPRVMFAHRCGRPRVMVRCRSCRPVQLLMIRWRTAAACRPVPASGSPSRSKWRGLASSSLKASGGRRVAGPCVLRPLFGAPPGRVVNRGGRVGRKSLPPAGAAEVRGRSFHGAGGHRVDHQIVRAVLASRFVRCRGQGPSPWALILHAMRERHRGQIERWRTVAVRR